MSGSCLADQEMGGRPVRVRLWTTGPCRSVGLTAFTAGESDLNSIWLQTNHPQGLVGGRGGGTCFQPAENGPVLLPP